MDDKRIAKEILRVAREMVATREHYDSLAEMPRGLQEQFGAMVDGGEVEVVMSPDGTTWVSDLSENSVVSYKGRMMVWFKYGGPGLDKIRKLDERVLTDYFNDRIMP